MATEADLRKKGANSFYKEKFLDLQLSQETMEAREFENCTFTRCTCIDVIFAKCRFLDCAFEGCTLSAVQFPNSSFTDVRFSRSKVIGIDWSQARAANLGPLVFTECELNYSSFSTLTLRKLVLHSCRCREVDFVEADLTDGDFEGTDFELSRFFKTNLTNANFRKAAHYQIDVFNNTIKKAQFSLPEALALLQSLDITLDP
ncbi:MAG TPA: pentapeptide repeat-containing protein [Ktedonobacterales bacterium]|nr:pentapeptide repeat-containing protein [Ktedonobacterales bacterium]